MQGIVICWWVYLPFSLWLPWSLCEQRPIALNTPTFVELDNIEGVTITLVDANHCSWCSHVRALCVLSLRDDLDWLLHKGSSSKVHEVISFTRATFAPSSLCEIDCSIISTSLPILPQWGTGRESTPYWMWFIWIQLVSYQPSMHPAKFAFPSHLFPYIDIEWL